MLLDYLSKYGNLSLTECEIIKQYFIPLEIKKRNRLIEKNNNCNKLFFVNSGFIRAYYINEKGNEITRMITGENNFLTNILSFRGISENNETIECVKNSEILYIYRADFDLLLNFSLNLKCIYADILEEYNAQHIKRFEVLNSLDIKGKFDYLKCEFPHFIKEFNDSLLASFLGISRVHFANNKNFLYM